LTALTSLKSLSLEDTEIGDDTVKSVACLPLLESLSLANTHVTDKCIDDIIAMKNIKEVRLPDSIGDEARKRLITAKRGIRAQFVRPPPPPPSYYE
jgi:hypothetical protein